MANWSNCRLVVLGPRASLTRFSKRFPVRPSSKVWGPYFRGETSDLFAERISTISPGLSRKAYMFQVARGDGKEHFQSLSRQAPDLGFVLVYACPGVDNYGSYLLRNGSARSYRLPAQVLGRVMAKHGVTSSDDDTEDWRFWDAASELMDLAEAHWSTAVKPR